MYSQILPTHTEGQRRWKNMTGNYLTQWRHLSTIHTRRHQARTRDEIRETRGRVLASIPKLNRKLVKDGRRMHLWHWWWQGRREGITKTQRCITRYTSELVNGRQNRFNRVYDAKWQSMTRDLVTSWWCWCWWNRASDTKSTADRKREVRKERCWGWGWGNTHRSSTCFMRTDTLHASLVTSVLA